MQKRADGDACEMLREKDMRSEKGIWLNIGALVALALSLFARPAAAADQTLIDAAKKEGSVTWYTTQIIDQFVAPAAAAFEKKYGIRVNYVRANSEDVVLRIFNEAKANKVQADVFDGTGSKALVDAGLVLQWLPDSAKRLPPQYVDANGYWIATNLYVHVTGINTDLVPRATEPKTYQDLLDPKWKGKMAWSAMPSSTAAPGFIGLILTEMGQDKGMAYLRELAKQDIIPLGVSAREVANQLVAGEFPLALHMNINHIVISRQRGAPVDWIAIQPALAFLSIIGKTKDSPHPNAGKLLIDYLVSSEGQTLYRDADYIPVDPDVPPRDPSLRPDGVKFRAHYVSPDNVNSSVAAWWKVYQDVFR
jgi:iron(III) transport system substrate-binding protein